MTTAAELASYASSFPSFRNRMINGNLSNPINQRGAASITASTGYTYDRWYYDGSTYLYQGIEDKNVNNGTYVISWEGSGINAAWKVSTDTTANNGPDATSGFTSVSNGGTFTVNEGTEYSKHLWIRFDGTLANLDKVMVEEGTVATPFEHRPTSVELSLCQRYFFNFLSLSGLEIQSYTTTLLQTTVYFPVPMRSDPALTTITSDRIGLGGFSNISTTLTSGTLSYRRNSTGSQQVTIRFTSSATITAGLSYIIFPNAVNSGATFSSEL
jgi:hypothetical protein